MSAASSDNGAGRLIQDGARRGEFNMAADVYLSQEAGRSGQIMLRLYAWDQPTLSLGFHQKFDDGLRQPYGARGIPIVRRPTGGRAVLHDQELTYCLAIPVNHRLVTDGKDRLQENIGRAFVEAGRRVGLRPQLVRRGIDDQGAQARLASGSPLCFDSISRWEVRLNGRKWIGSAQRIFPDVFLQHGSILLKKGETRSDVCAGMANTARGKTQDLINVADLRKSIPEAFARQWDILWSAASFSADEVMQIEMISSEKDIVQRTKIAS